MSEGERKCDFYLVRQGRRNSNTAMNYYKNSKEDIDFCTTHPCPHGGVIDGTDQTKKGYSVKKGIVIPLSCRLTMLSET